MTVCPRCGTQNAPHLPACALCGMLLARGIPKGTLVGISPFGAPGPSPWGAEHEPVPETQPPPEPGAPEPAPREPAAAPKGLSTATLLGVAPPLPGEPAGQAPRHDPQRLGRTMIGLAPLAAGQAREQPAPANTEAAPGGPPPPTGAPTTRTILGVARPGIAPLEPGVAKPPGTAPEPSAATAPEGPGFALPSPPPDPDSTSIPAPPSSPTLASGSPRPAPRGVPVLAALAVTFAAALFAAGVVVLVLHRSTGPIEGRAALGPDGKERIELTCAECPDGTRVALGGKSATITAQRAAIELARPLAVGENRLSLLLTRPGETKSSEVTLAVPVQYRVRADPSPLAEPQPKLRVLVEALPKSRVSVDGKPLALDASGRGVYDLDVERELTGQNPQVTKLERSVPYSVTPPGAGAETGAVRFQLGVSALAVEAPGERITIDTPTFVLSGKTQRGGAVQVSERPIAVDAEGRFAQVMSVSSEGETTIVVRASAPEHAPRLYPIHVKRVARLADEAARLRPDSLASYAALGEADALAGKAVALEGSLLEHRAEGYASYLLLDVTNGCQTPPCLLRVVHGAPVRLERGATLSVFGHVTGSVEGARTGTRVPEVFASFVLPGSR